MTQENATGDPLRARTWDEFIGQSSIKERLEVHIRGAVAEKRMLDHVLLAGPPGFGKTSLAGIIAARLNDDFQSVTMPIKLPVFVKLMRTWTGGVLLLDEIHRGTRSQQEDLLSVLLDGELHLPNGRSVQCPWMTIIGATTEPEKVIPPLYDRFPIKPNFEEYSEKEMGQIVQGMALKLDVDLEWDTCLALGRAAGGTPRHASAFVMAARDLAHGPEPVTAESILRLCEVTDNGLTAQHRRYLEVLQALDGKAGMAVLSAMLRLHPSVIHDIERRLLNMGLIAYGERGRELTDLGYKQGAPDPVAARGGR